MSNELRKPPSDREIQRAHDFLKLIVMSETEYEEEETEVAIYASLLVICWILGHPRGDQFLENLVIIEADLASQGIFFSNRENENNDKP